MKSSFCLIFTLLLFLLSQNICFAQSKEIDSLQNLLKTADDTTKVNLKRRLAGLLRSKDKEKAVEMVTSGIELAKKINYPKGEIESLFSLGIIHGMTGSYPESLEVFKQCLALSKEHKNYEHVYKSYNSFGIIYKQIGDYPTSKDYYLKCIKLVDSLNLSLDITAAYTNLGVLYDLMDEPENAKKQYERALEIYSGSNRESLENIVVSNLALLDMNENKYTDALEKLLKSKEYQESENEKLKLCTTYSNIAQCYLNLNQSKLAEEYFVKSLELSKQLSNKTQIAVSYYGLAELMLQQNKYPEAIDYSKKNLEALNKTGGYKYFMEAHDLAHEIYTSTKQFPDAIYHLKQSVAFRDSLLNETKVKEIQNLQIQHDVYLKDREIKENKLELELMGSYIDLNQKRIGYLSIIALLLLFSASLLYFRYRSKQKSNAMLVEKNILIYEQKEIIQEMNIELEKRMLRAQMNPHFIFNSLSSIQHLINSNDRKGALTYLSKFSKLLRQVLETSINISLPLKDEIELLKIYIELEALRFDNSFTYDFKVDENLDIHNAEIPMLLVQPYIENAIIHGLMPKKGNKELKVSFHESDDNIVCTIEDNGVGMSSKPKESSYERPSRGMSITAKRIEALKKFSNQELVRIQSSKEGTKVTILIPKD
ncbi:tetratricopeptide repeat-containing sensor histidine kinase [Flagellimonas marinaquae]|uniref:tetratricopeptide repeat-containing sensor histidine kinase n=1 Tax=Flagellimonas marinaquae TaxID=254955 RepID=UPI00207601B8|nr:tetratricopeptide repeat protein [Allomuricauda aquimarina]USD24877.1 tetratricopeptide repeat protein [Allomuricauda aquimarina]